MDYKHILPIEINYALKHFKDRVVKHIPEVDENIQSCKKRVFFLDVPAYGNIGDQAIAYAMEAFISDVMPDYKQIEITEDILPSSLKWLRRIIEPEDIICLTGGGNMGVMYQRYEAVRRLVLKNFPNNPIIIFPQTFDYGNNRYASMELKRAVKLYGTVKRLVLCARDEDSFFQMQKYFTKAKVISCPDIVLYLDYRNKYKKSNEVGICFRNDKERVLTEEEQEKIRSMFPSANVLTTMDETDLPISKNNRQKVVERKLKEFGLMKLILTDRLHGMIFSFITDTPCIAFPNSNGKVEHVSKYLSKKGNVIFSNSITGFVPKWEEKNETMKSAFTELADIIRSVAKAI